MFQLSTAAQRNALLALIALHIALIIASNYLVQLPILLWGWHTTWGAFSFPFLFLVTDLTVRLIGKQAARTVIARVMLPALVASYIVSVLFHDGVFTGWESLAAFNLFVFRISLGSFLAYALGQLLDVQVFDRLRRLRQWWVAPLAASVVGQAVDTLVFFSVAFWRSTDPFMASHWVEIAWVDYVIKIVVSTVVFLPLYGALLQSLLRWLPAPAHGTHPTVRGL
ncbi:MAG: 7-cyano-7-deazaguanine/7-aminomethyl-7-deazaguanine transporter [Comamonas sp.]|nr:7-cyano-7-deazaguanine/7-aminomethyl-7-deazaguanine transporter [Comamonas sp.]